MLRRLLPAVALAVLTTALACGSSNSGSGSGPGLSPNNGGVGPQRSSACLAFQDAECDHFADKCQKLTREDCEGDFQSLYCKSDADAQACTAGLRAAACGDDQPAACLGLADVDAARAACSSLFSSICVAIDKCTGQDKAACEAQLAPLCTNAIGVGPTAGDCVAAADTGCENGEYKTPAVCKGIVKTSSSTSALPFESPAFGRVDLREMGQAPLFEAAVPRLLPPSPVAP